MLNNRRMTYKSHYRHRALRLAFGRWLHEPPLAREHSLKVGRLQHLVDLDRLGCPLKLNVVRLAILLQPIGRETRQRYRERKGGVGVLVEYLLHLNLALLLVRLCRRRVGCRRAALRRSTCSRTLRRRGLSGYLIFEL